VKSVIKFTKPVSAYFLFTDLRGISGRALRMAYNLPNFATTSRKTVESLVFWN